MIIELTRPGLHLPFRGSRQPEWPFTLNRDSPLAESLVAWMPFGITDHALFDFAGSRAAATKTGTPTLDSSLDSGLLIQDFNGADGWEFTHNPDFEPDGSDFLLCARMANVTSINSFAAFKGLVGWDLLIGSGGVAGDHSFRINAGVAGEVLWTGAPTTGLITMLAHFQRGTTTSTLKIYGDGLERASATMTGTNVTEAVGFDVGHRNAANFLTAQYVDLTIWKGSLSAGAAALRAWQMYDPRTRWGLYYPLHRRTFVFLSPEIIVPQGETLMGAACM